MYPPNISSHIGIYWNILHYLILISFTVWEVSKYGVFSGPYFPVFGPEKISYLDTFQVVFSSC